MPLPEPQVGDVVALNLYYYLNEQTILNTFHYSVSTRTPGPNGPTVLDVAKIVGDDLWDNAIHGLWHGVSSDCNNIAYTAQIIKPVRSIAAASGPTLHTTGGTGAPAMPTGVAVVISRKGNLANKHNQGRIYIGGIDQADVTDSALQPGSPTHAALTTFAPRIITDQTLTVGLVTLTLVAIICPLPAATPIVPLTNFQLHTIIRYQRRRELRVGI